jgi:hypothetical protein
MLENTKPQKIHFFVGLTVNEYNILQNIGKRDRSHSISAFPDVPFLRSLRYKMATIDAHIEKEKKVRKKEKKNLRRST